MQRNHRENQHQTREAECNETTEGKRGGAIETKPQTQPTQVARGPSSEPTPRQSSGDGLTAAEDVGTSDWKVRGSNPTGASFADATARSRFAQKKNEGPTWALIIKYAKTCAAGGVLSQAPQTATGAQNTDSAAASRGQGPSGGDAPLRPNEIQIR